MKELFATGGAKENREGLKRKIDLQLFADGGSDDTGSDSGNDSKKALRTTSERERQGF